MTAKPLRLPAIQALGCGGGEAILSSWVAVHFPGHGSRADHLGLMVLTSDRLAFLESTEHKITWVGMYNANAYRLVGHLTWPLENITEIGTDSKWGARYLQVAGHIFHVFRFHPQSVIDEVVHARAQRVAATQARVPPATVTPSPMPVPPQVGTPVQRPCPFCGKWGPTESDFCHKCGKPLPSISGR